MRSLLHPLSWAFLLSFDPAATASDWPCWRGPARDGRVAGFTVPSTWPKDLRRVWRVSVGEGHASPVAAGERIFLLTREKEDEVVRCVALSSGKEVWRTSYPAPYEVNSDAKAHGAGPKSTPAVAGGSVYTLGIGGILSCFDAGTGDVRWRRELSKEFQRSSPLYGTAMSPLVEAGLCIAHVGGHDKGALRAFDAATGETRWSWDGDGPGYSSPIAVDLAGERQLVTQTQRSVAGFSLRSGRLLWSVPFTTEYHQNIVTVVAFKDLVLYSGYSKGVTALRVVREGERLVAREAWTSEDASMYMSSPVLSGDLLFGLSQKQKGQVFCLDPATGKTLWKGSGRAAGENGAFLDAGKALILLTTDAELVFLKPGADAYERLATYKVADSPTWAHPLVAGDLIVVKDRTSLACFSLKGEG